MSRSPSIPWKQVSLEEIAEFRNGINYNKKNFGEGIRVIGVKDFQDRSFPEYDNLEQINPQGVVRNEHILREGDVIFVRSNGNRELIGRSLFIRGLPSDPITHSAFTIRVRMTSPDADPRFFAYLFRSRLIRDVLSAQGNGANISNLNQDILSRLQVPLPALREQERITSILSAYDELIENNTRRIAILEEMARRIYEEWFVRFRFPGHENVRMVESDLGPVPEEWSTERLDQVCDVTDYVANGSFASLKQNVTYCSEPDYAVLVRGTDFNSGWNGSYVYVTEHSYRFLKKSRLVPGDIVVTNVGNVGITFRVPDLGRSMTLGPNAVLVRPKFGELYIFHLLRSNRGQHLIRGITSGAAQPKFNKTEFRALRILIPTEQVLDAFDSLCRPMHDLTEKLRSASNNLRATRDLLLPKLISGELDVSPIPEPEAVVA